MINIKTILHPTDFSENAGHVFRLACALARDYGARLILVYVRPVPPVSLDGGMVYEPEPAALEEALREQLYALQPGDARIPAERHLRMGDEATEIIALAKEKGCDLIVMGTHGRTGLGRLLMGSVAEQVVRKAPCPVLTVKVPVPAAEAEPEAACGTEKAPEARVAVKLA